MNMELIISAREISQENTDYLSLSEHGLAAVVDIAGGDGSALNPYDAVIKLVNNGSSAWNGIIHIELPFKKINPRFFLPAFMYGRNRGESPQNVPNEFPRLREEMKRPSSPWWMVRSDRLSHPVALVYDTDKIYGICAGPYYVIQNGLKQQWKPGTEGAFYQYAGFTCSLSKGTVGYTLGYENAPWMFVQSHTVKERAALGENCFGLEIGKAVELHMYLYEYAAESELDINAAIKEVYYRYYQSPRKNR